jgi:hypothetical protein
VVEDLATELLNASDNWLSVSSRAVVNWRGDFLNAFLSDRPVNNARQGKSRLER